MHLEMSWPEMNHFHFTDVCICAVAVHSRSAEKSPGVYDCSLLRPSSAWQPAQRTWARWDHMISGVKVSCWSAGGRSSPQTHCQIANISLSLQGVWGSHCACLAIMCLCGNICVQLTVMHYKFVGESLLPSKSCWEQTNAKFIHQPSHYAV